eukprot:RCo010562
MAEERRSWDKAEFAAKAKTRLKDAYDELRKPTKSGGFRDRQPREPLPPSRAFLKGRDYTLNMEEKYGKTQVVTANLPAAQQAGFYCKVCDCVVKDSANYLDHINGKKHQRHLGMCMRVERVGVEQVREKFAELRRKRDAEQ